jgi:four helix bundle protein
VGRWDGGGFRDLVAWQKAYELAFLVYQLTKSFPRDEQYGLTSQMRRAAVSVAANIAEGYERQSRRDYLQFLRIARGSLGELETYLRLAIDLEYADHEAAAPVIARQDEVGRLLRGLMRSLESA